MKHFVTKPKPTHAKWATFAGDADNEADAGVDDDNMDDEIEDNVEIEDAVSKIIAEQEAIFVSHVCMKSH